ncbi:MAG: acyl-CoA dehydrogenase family protein [Syntrophaceae bacterium]
MPSGMMEQIYRGELDPGIYNAFAQKHDFSRARDLVQKYRELLQKFPVASIEESGRIPAEMLAGMKKSGLFGISVPGEHGGLGFSLFEYLKVIEEVSRIDMSPALVFVAHLSIGIRGIELFGTPEQKSRYLPRAASGEMIFSYALTEPLTGSDAKSITTQASISPDGSHYILNGTKTYITNANYAGGLTVFARLDQPGRLIAFIVETAWEGVKIGADMPKMGLKASSTASIQFKNVKVPIENVIGAPGDGFRLAMMVLNYGRLGLGAASIGAMEQGLADMWKRAGSRVQFGKPIRHYQLVQEKIARTRVNADAMSAMNELAASILSDDPLRETAIETSHCKLYGTTRAWKAVYDALQVAGGSGYLTTQPYEKRMRDFRVTTIFEGTTEIHSMYPALLGLRRLGKELRALKGMGRIAFILKEFLSSYKPPGWKADHNEPLVRQAFLLAGANSQTIRRMLLLSLLVYGEKAAEREYLLRRITSISLYTFAVLALASKSAKQDNISGIEKESLACLIEEAREVRRRCSTLADTRLEILESRLIGQMEGQSP